MASTAERIQQVLDDLFPNPPIPLRHRSDYELLIAVVLSAQCTDERVNKTTPLLFEKGHTPEGMVALSVEEIEEIIRSCGLAPRKARAIWGLSEMLIELHDGRVPSTFEELEALPGVGHKTASVVISHVHGLPAFPVDTHIHRCAKRWGLSNGKNVEQTEKDLKKAFPDRGSWHKLHLQIIYFARKYCPARGHDPKECPICSWIE